MVNWAITAGQVGLGAFESDKIGAIKSADKVIHPPLPGQPVHALPVLNHNKTDHHQIQWRTLYSYSSVNQLWYYSMTSSLCQQIPVL